MILAQQPTGTLPVPEIAWSAFAPEIPAAAVAVVLLMIAIAGRRRLAVAVPVGLITAAVGVWLVAGMELIVPGAVAIALGAGFIATVVAANEHPALIQVWGAGLGAMAALVLTIWQYVSVLTTGEAGQAVAQTVLSGSVAVDGIAVFTRITVYVTVLLTLPMGYGYLRDRGIYRPEFEPLLLLSATGMALLGAAQDLITLFVALEILSIALYILAGLARRDRRSQESSIKYFVTGAVASAVLLYGMAMLYIATGTLDIASIGTQLGLVTAPIKVAILGLALVLAGIGFKVALVPFQLWTPDVYQGSPTNVTGFMAAATKAAGFAALLRLFLLAFGRLDAYWVPILAILSAATMLYGAIAALVQHDVKRILAYSSIAHAGYATIGLVANNDTGLRGTLWYLLTYAVTTMASFGVIIALERRRRGEITLKDLRGLGKTAPVLAAIFALSLLSLAGIPPTAGFAGKLIVFQAGIEGGYAWLVVIGVISSVIAGFFYLRLMGMMFLEEPEEGTELPVTTTGLSVATSLSAALVVVLGIQPELLLSAARTAAVLAR